MDLIIGSYKCRLEICLLIIIISWILFGHLFCSCSRIGFKEGFEIGKQLYNNVTKKEEFGGKKGKNTKEKFGNKNKNKEAFKNI